MGFERNNMKTKKKNFLIFFERIEKSNIQMEPLPMSLFCRFVKLPTFATVTRDGELNAECPSWAHIGKQSMAVEDAGDWETCSLMIITRKIHWGKNLTKVVCFESHFNAIERLRCRQPYPASTEIDYMLSNCTFIVNIFLSFSLFLRAIPLFEMLGYLIVSLGFLFLIVPAVKNFLQMLF